MTVHARKRGHDSKHLHLVASPITPVVTGEHHEEHSHEPEHGHGHGHGDGKPGFLKHHEAGSTELFYDLFFVANLSTFTIVHPVNDSESLSSYIGFFSLLWFTWLQVTLFDVRFSNDSIMERIMKGFQLAGMVAFSATSLKFLPSTLIGDWGTLIDFSLILMVTRVALSMQYLVTAWASRGLKSSKTPLLCHAATYLLSAIIYAGLAGSFANHLNGHAYIAWFVISILESIATVVIAKVFKVASFRDTPLGERLSLLTLIIIGEGIIVLMKSIQYVVKNGTGYSAATTGHIICVGLIYYFLYMLYFDKLQKNYFGLVREEAWALLHFPFHVALVLFVEGINEMMVAYRYFVEFSRYLGDLASNFVTPDGLHPIMNSTTNIYDIISPWIDNLAYEFPEAVAKGTDIDKITIALNKLNDTFVPATSTNFAKNEDFNTVMAFGLNQIFLSFGLKESDKVKKLSLVDRIGADYEIFQLIFGYLFICGGLVLIFIAILAYINSTHKTGLSTRNKINLGVHGFFGLGLTLISTMLTARIKYSTNGAKTLLGLIENTRATKSMTFVNFSLSPWILPLILFCYAIVLIVEMTIYFLNRPKGESVSHRAADHMKADDTQYVSVAASAYNSNGTAAYTDHKGPEYSTNGSTPYAPDSNGAYPQHGSNV